MQDLRFALRTLRKQPVFTLVAVLTLTLGIGANTAIFSLLYQTLLRPLPYPNADRLVFVWNTLQGHQSRSGERLDPRLPRSQDTGAGHRGRDALHAARTANLNEGGNPGAVARARRHAVVLLDAPAAAVPRPRVQRRRGEAGRRQVRDPDLRPVDVALRGGSRRSSGATSASTATRTASSACCRRDFELPGRDIALLVPFAFTPAQMSDNARGNEFSQMIARLRPGASIEQLNGADEGHHRPRRSSGCRRAPQFMKSSQFGGFARQHPRSARRRRSRADATCCRPACCWCCSSPAPTSPTCC